MADTANASVVVRFRTEGVDAAKRAIASLTAEGARADSTRARSVRTGASAQQLAERGISQTQAQETRKRSREAQLSARTQAKAARDQHREVGQSFRTFFRQVAEQEKKAADEAKKRAREVSDAKKKELREVASSMQSFFAGVRAQEDAAEQRARTNAARARQRTIDRRMYLGGALIAGVGGGLAMARQAQGVMGVRSQEEILTNAVELRQALITQTATAGVSRDQRDSLFQGAADIGRRTGVSPEQMLQTMMTQQELFSVVGNAGQDGQEGIRALLTELEAFAQIARATRSDVNDVAGSAYAMRDQFGLTSEEMINAMYQLSQGAQDGSLSMRDFAQQFPQVFGSFLSARGAGARGEAGTTEVSSVAQAIRRQQGSGPGSSERTRTLLAAMLTNISDRHVQRRLQGVGVDATDDAGNIRPIADIAQQMVGNRKVQGSTRMRTIFGDQEASAAWQAIIAQEEAAARGEAGAMSLRDRQAATAAQGRQGIENSLAELDADASGRAVRMRAEREANVLGDSERLINAMADLAGPLTSMQDAFPRIAMGLESLMPVLQALAPSLATLAALKAGGTVAAGLGAGTVAAGTGTAGGVAGVGAGIGGAGLTGTLSATGLGVVIAAGAGGIYLTRQEQERAAAERRANMSPSQGDLQDFTTGNLPSRDLLTRGMARRDAQQASLPSLGPGGWSFAGGDSPGGGSERVVDATRDSSREIVRSLEGLRSSVDRLRPAAPTGDTRATGQRR